MSDKTIRTIRTPHTTERPYFSMSRATAQDKNLSFEARGMLAYLLSKPDDWKIKVKDLEQQCKEDRVYRILKELQNAGYVHHVRIRGEKGVFSSGEYRVYETPHRENPDVVKPDVGYPDVDNPDTYILENLQSKESDKSENKDNSPNGAAVKPNPFFEAISKTFNIPINAGMIKQYAAFLAGNAKQGEWAKYRVEPGMNAEDVTQFGQWYKRTYPKLLMPSKPMTIQKYVYEWRSKKPVLNPQQPNAEPKKPTFERMKYE